MKHRVFSHSVHTILGLCALVLGSAAGISQSTTNAVVAKPAGGAEVAGTNGTAEMSLTREAIEQLRRDIEAAASRNTAAITAGLARFTPTIEELQRQQAAVIQNSNRTILIVVASFAGVGLVALMSIIAVLMRALTRFSEFAHSTTRGVVYAAGPPVPALGPGDMVSVNANAVEQASGRFQHAIEHLQKRIFELEHAAQPGAIESGKAVIPPKPVETLGPVSAINISPLPAQEASVVRKVGEAADAASRTGLLLGKGQALLNLDQAEQALECFDQILALDPNHTEALLRRGLALERMENWEKALECYDRAIALDGALTVAYLYKGGICNKLQRHREALESYEHALRAERRSRAS
ncbi:MAG TPA: tetratricopeptide repeat protein [Verrucomicrobiae bacterium]|nr:tetratricopeptide repeat protein [Verrucomicrobiae bacterium]